MGKTLRVFGIFTMLAFGVGAAYASASVPEMLIIQRKVDKNHDGDPNLEIGDFVAQELQDSARVSPIYWSMSDSIFRSLVNSGKVSASAIPSVESAEALAKTMKITYVMVVEAHFDRTNTVLARAELYKGAELIWKDPSDEANLNKDLEDKLVKRGIITRLDADRLKEAHGYRNFLISGTSGLDRLNTLRSMAHTWVELMNSGALSGLTAKPTQASPDPIVGPLQKLDQTAPVAPKHLDNAQVFKNVEQAVRDNHKGTAILLLRDAVDASPFDLPLRQALIKLLNETGQPELAASEANRAAGLNPSSNTDLKLDGARAHLVAGNYEAAQSAAKDALARNPKDGDAHLILGECRLFSFDFSSALSELNLSVEIAPVTEALYYRSIAKAFTGDATGAKSDCDSAHHGSVVQATPSYTTTTVLIDGGLQKVFDGLRDLIPSISLGKNPDDLNAALAKFQGAATGLAAFINSWEVPKNHSSSHERRILALKLLAQASGELVAYLGKRDDELLTDARIDLGEAMKQYKAAKDLFVGEESQ